jgi:phosphatidylglycerophosphate synthase
VLDQYARLPKKYLYQPISKRWKASPNQVSCAGFLAGLAAAGTAAQGAYKVAFAFWVLNRLLDGLDGEIARAQNSQTDFGGYLDIVLDFIVYTAIPIALVYSMPGSALWLLLALLLGSFFVNAASLMYLAAILEKRDRGAEYNQEKTSVTMPPGLIEGAETVIFYSLFLLYPGHLQTLFALMAGLVGLNILWRLLWAYRQLRDPR